MSIKNTIDELKQHLIKNDEFLEDEKNKESFKLVERLENEIWSAHMKAVQLTSELASIYNIKE